jgi:hypothetical protein
MVRLAAASRHRFLTAAFTAALCLVPALTARGALITVEPDDYAAGTVLTSVNPHVTLRTMLGDGRIPFFAITAAEGDSATADLSPTGTLVFAHEDVPFFYEDRKLLAEFNGTTSSVSITLAGASFFEPMAARLEVYGASGELLEVDVTDPTNYGVFETLAVTRPTPDIARAVIYSVDYPFGRFDALTFATPVPEPGALGLLALGPALLLARRR